MVEPILQIPGEPHERRPGLGYAMVALAATLSAVNGTVSKVILKSGISAQQLTEVRCAGAVLGLVLLATATRPGSLRVARTDVPLLVALGVGGLAHVQWSYFYAIARHDIGIAPARGRALSHITSTRAGITGMLEPVVAIVVAWAWLGESLDAVQLSAL